MNVFDFDGTIYDGDSSVDFWLFCLKKKPSLIRFFPRQISGVYLYKIGKISKEEFKGRFFSFFEAFPDIDIFVKKFWDKKQYKIKEWYKKRQREDDCVISASPSFLLYEICLRFGIRNLIATEVDRCTGEIIGNNCHDKNKPKFFLERFGNVEIDEFYSDSISDEPMAILAKKAFLVKREKIYDWKL